MNFIVQQPPALEHDAMMLARFGQDVSADGRTERRIVYNLCEYLAQHGFRLNSVWDGEESDIVNTPQEAMELIFNLDEAHLYVRKEGYNVHWIYLVLGNGIDVIADFSYTEGNPDNFSETMDAFDAEYVASAESVEACMLSEMERLKAAITDKVDHALLITAMDMLQQIRKLCNS